MKRTMPRWAVGLAALGTVLATACTGANPTAAPTQSEPASPSPTAARASPTASPPVAAPTLSATDTSTTSVPASTATAVPTAASTRPPLPTATPIRLRERANGPVNRIAFAGLDGAIYTVKSDGSDLRQVSATRAEGSQGQPPRFTWPVWAPDGGSLVFTASTPVLDVSLDVSLMRAPARGEHPPVLLYTGVPSVNGVGPGTPHYALWSPDGQRILLIAGDGSGLSTINLDSDTGRDVRGIADSQPIYLAWSHDSRNLLVHLDDRLFLHRYDATGRSLGYDRIGNGSISYLAPQWSPTANEYLYTDRGPEGTRLMRGTTELRDPTALVAVDQAVAFRWSPSGDRFGMMTTDGGLLFDTFTIMSRDGTSIGNPIESEFYGFWWSPDGSRVALATNPDDGSGGVAWTILDVVSGETEQIAVTQLSEEMYFMLTFFDQFGQSHQLWSPDSSSLTVPGQLVSPSTFEVSASCGCDTTKAAVWVLDAEGDSAPLAVGAGHIAAWSPR